MKSPYESQQQPNSDPQEPLVENSRSKPIIMTVFIFTLMSVTYRLIVHAGKEQTALLFIGIPAILAILLSFLPTPGSATGKIMKGTALCILLVGVLVGEGLICLLIAAPLFFLVGALIGWFLDWKPGGDENSTKFRSVVGVALAVTCLEGITETLSFDREEEISTHLETTLSIDEVRAKLANGPQFALEELPVFLKVGFPTPQHIEGGGLQVGNEWKIHFTGGEGSPGDLVMKVTESSPQSLRLKCVKDTSHIAHWLDWKEAIWTLEETPNGTNVTMTLSYDRQLDPAWYFRPTERYGVRKAAEYFLEQTLNPNEL